MSDKNTKIEKISLEDHFQDRDFLRIFWEEISLKLKKELGDAKWRAWIKPLSIQKVNKGILVLLAENDLTRDRVKAQYSDKIKIFGYNLNKNIKNVKIKTNDKKFETNANSEIFKNGQIDKDKELVLFCAGGIRSETAVKSLTEKGFKNISHIEGGFVSISNSSFKIV